LTVCDRLNGHQLLPLVRAGVPFVDGLRLERDDAATKAAPIKSPKKMKNQPEKSAA